MNNIIADYLLYNKGNECPEKYHVWGILSVIASVVGKRTKLLLSAEHDAESYIEVSPNLYCCLVGPQGDGKTTAMRIAKQTLSAVAPQLPMASSVMSREQIVKFLSAEEQLRSYKTHDGIIEEVRPFSMFINEFNNFISFNPVGMVQFLTDIYDEKVFDSSTIARGVESIVNPCVNVLACVVPEWLRSELKSSVISGGFCRRMIFVYNTAERPLIPFPTIDQESKDARGRVLVRLHDLYKAELRPFRWGPGAREFYAKWYMQPRKSDDPIMSGYLRSKHIQLLKVAMLVSLSQSNDCVLMPADIEVALAMLDTIETNMSQLSQGIGASKLAFPMTRIVEFIEAGGGAVPEKKLLLFMGRDIEPRQVEEVLKHLITTDQIVKGEWTQNGVSRMMYFTKAKYVELETKQKLAEERARLTAEEQALKGRTA
jgi:hypothetical protein